MEPLAVYIHWPFCKSKCPYCDFNSHVRDKIEQQEWLNTYLKEINFFLPSIKNKQVTSIFFGGGTPSLMEPFIAEGIINHLKANLAFAEDVEITLEANPTSAELQKFKDFKKAGINRLSIGVQALNNKDLAFLGREHNSDEALKALDMARDTFDRFSFDLIYARPGQTLENWRQELEKGIALSNGHMSLYQLTIEKGTPFYAAHLAGKFTLPSEDVAAEMYDLTEDMMTKNSMPSYEVSNYAGVGQESRHNMAYWHYDEYIGIGPGAHSRVNLCQGREEIMMIHNPEGWMKEVKQSGRGIQTRKITSKEQQAEEAVMMGLRLTEGLDLKRFNKITGMKITDFCKQEKLDFLASQDLLEINDKTLKATRKGRLVLNNLIEQIVADIPS